MLKHTLKYTVFCVLTRETYFITALTTWIFLSLKSTTLKLLLSCLLHYKITTLRIGAPTPCGGELEYLTVVPASRKRRRRGNILRCESNVWLLVLSDRPVSDCTVKLRTHPLVRKNNKAIVTKERIRIKSGHRPQKGARYQDELVD
jgi:hypothetical protein